MRKPDYFSRVLASTNDTIYFGSIFLPSIFMSANQYTSGGTFTNYSNNKPVSGLTIVYKYR